MSTASLLVVEAGVDALGVGEAPHEEPRAHERHQRQRHLAGDQQVAQAHEPVAANAAPPPRCFSSSTRSGREALQRRRQAEHERGQRATRPTVKPSTRRSGVRSIASAARPGGRVRPQHALGPVRDQEAEAAGEEREQQALGEELAHQPAARGAEREAHRHLALARRRAREQQVRDVRAGDQQHQARPPSAAGPPRSPCSRGSPGLIVACASGRSATLRPPLSSGTRAPGGSRSS